MTKRRDLKRMVRLRQERTGEVYMTALRHVRAQHRDTQPRIAQRSGAVPVVELTDVSDIAMSLGLLCRLMVVPELAARIDVTATLKQLRRVLVATTRDHAFSLLRATVLCGERPFASWPKLDDLLRFRDRTLAGIGGIDESGRLLAFVTAAQSELEMVVFTLWHTPARYVDVPPSVLLTPADFMLGDPDREWDLRPSGIMAVMP